MSHTPGPWEMDGARIKKDENLTIARVGVAFDGDWSEANARLIAAAPDLLDACKQAETMLRYWGKQDGACYELINDAIAKAEGTA